MLTRTYPKPSWIQLHCEYRSEMSEKKEDEETVVISVPVVMAQIERFGCGNLPEAEWEHLAKFRICIPAPIAAMMVDCLFQLCNGRIKS